MDQKVAKLEWVIQRIRSMGNPDAVARMAKYGINPKDNYGASVNRLRGIAKEIGF